MSSENLPSPPSEAKIDGKVPESVLGAAARKLSGPLKEGESWEALALCAELELGIGIFFPKRGKSDKEAKRICGRCAVTSQCLDFALENNVEFGVWGGMNAEERKKLKGQSV